MVWLFISVVMIIVVYLAVQFPAFRKAILVYLALLFIAVAAGAGWLYYEKIENDKRKELSRRLIRPDEIVFTDTVLAQTYWSWKVKGNVTNRSSHELSGFTLKIIVRCPVWANAVRRSVKTMLQRTYLYHQTKCEPSSM